MCRQKLSKTLAGKQMPVRSAKPWSHRKHCLWVFSPLPALHFSLLFSVIIKGLPLPLPLLSICGHCQRAQICVSQSSYRITKDPKLAKKGLKIACSSTLYMEGKAKQPKWSARSGYWGMGHPSQGSVLYSAWEGKHVDMGTIETGSHHACSPKWSFPRKLWRETLTLSKTGPIFPF